jgi:uncharacterized membrane protein YqhA
MRRLLEASKYLTLIAVVATMVSSAAVLTWGMYKTGDAIVNLIDTQGKDPLITAQFIKVMDIFLVAIAMMILSFGIYTLFIGELTLPEWLEIKNFQSLKIKLSNVIVLVMAVAFAERVLEWEHALNTLYFGIAITLVSVALIAFNYVSMIKE